jgi:hypothetical protein
MSFSLDADGTVDVMYLEDGVLICTDGRIDCADVSRRLRG